MAGVLGIYGLIIAVIIGNAVKPQATGGGAYSDYSAFTGFAHLAAGLCCGCVRVCIALHLQIPRQAYACAIKP